VVVSPDDRPGRDVTAGQGGQDTASRQAARAGSAAASAASVPGRGTMPAMDALTA